MAKTKCWHLRPRPSGCDDACKLLGIRLCPNIRLLGFHLFPSCVSQPTESIHRRVNSLPVISATSCLILLSISRCRAIMRIDNYISGTLAMAATSLSASILDGFSKNGPAVSSPAIDTTASLMKREEPPPGSEATNLVKKAFIQCPEHSGLPPMACSMHICGGQSDQRPGYCNDNYPSARSCQCTFLPSDPTVLMHVMFLVLRGH